MSFRAFDLLNLVKDFGEPLTYRQVTTEGTYNPNTGSVTGAATTDTNFTGYMYDYVSQNASEVLRGSRKCVIPSLGFAPEPEPDDTIVGSGDTVKVSRVVTLFSAGTAVCYICDVEE
tara:strand:+ start:1683 stop:2033 length:351 start_codon:yes stop_codon:yes gene_type:complete